MAEWHTYEKAIFENDQAFSSLDIRERMGKFGSNSISNLDLVVAILGSGIPGKPVRKLAKEVLDLITVSTNRFDIDKLMAIAGMGEAKSCAIAASIELGRRIFSARGSRIATPKDAFPLLIHFADTRQEHFIVISLNGGHEVNAVREITKGLINKTVVHPREVYADALTDRACAIIVAHNHPSGNLDPSEEDLDITMRLRHSGDILGIPLLDHLIFSEKGYFSFAEHSLIGTSKKE